MSSQDCKTCKLFSLHIRKLPSCSLSFHKTLSNRMQFHPVILFYLTNSNVDYTVFFSMIVSVFSFFADIDVNWCIPTIAHCFTESTHAGRVCPPLWVHSTLTLSDSTIIFYSRLICLNHLYSFWTWFPPLPPILPPLALFLCFAKVSVDTNSV